MGKTGEHLTDEIVAQIAAKQAFTSPDRTIWGTHYACGGERFVIYVHKKLWPVAVYDYMTDVWFLSDRSHTAEMLIRKLPMVDQRHLSPTDLREVALNGVAWLVGKRLGGAK